MIVVSCTCGLWQIDAKEPPEKCPKCGAERRGRDAKATDYIASPWEDLDVDGRMYGVFAAEGYSPDPIAIFSTEDQAVKWMAWQESLGDDSEIGGADYTIAPIERGAGPHVDPLFVTANCSSSPNFPACRIMVGIGKLATGGLTIAQSAELRALLERAENDVQSLVPSLHPGSEPVPPVTAAALIGSRCESCCRTIRLGAPVHVYDDAIVHAGPCPGEEFGDG